MTSPAPLRFRAGHVPGLAADALPRQVLRFAAHGRALEVEVPVLDAAQLQSVGARVRAAAGAQLASLPVDAIVEVVARVADRLIDPDDPLRRQADALLPLVTGQDPERVRLALTAYLHGFRTPGLRRFLSEDFPNPKVLDGFQPAMRGGSVRAIGPSLLVHSWAGNVPGLPMWSLVAGLLVKAGNVGKLPSAEPVFASLLAQALVRERPDWHDAFAVLWWPGGDVAAQPLYRDADVVLGYGSHDTLEALRAQVPAATRFLAHGHKLGVALVGRVALDRQRAVETVRACAHDVACHEQQGCYSPHTVYVERGGVLAPREFAQQLAVALAAWERRHPRRALALDEAAAVARWRQAAEWRALQGAGELIGDEAAAWAVAYDDRPGPPVPTPGHRLVSVCAVDALDQVPPLLAPHARVLQTAAVAADTDTLHRLADPLARAGVTRICALGAMTRPDAGWHHDGRTSLSDLVRWIGIEAGAEAAAQRLDPHWQEDLP